MVEGQKQPPEVFCKKGILKNFANFTGKQLCWSLILIKLQASGQQLYKKETPTQLFCYENYETFKNIYFKEHQQITASGGAV